MLRNYVLVAVRNLMRRKLYAGISVFGLAFGLALCLLVMGHISYELSFEDFHANKDRICRVEVEVSDPDHLYTTPHIQPSVAKALVDELPEAERVTVFRPEGLDILTIDGMKRRVIDEYATGAFVHHPTAMFATPEYLRVFSFPVKVGNPDAILSSPNMAFVTEEAAEKYFPNEDPVGKTVQINERYTCAIAGVLRSLPTNTQLYCDFVISYKTLESAARPVDTLWHPATDYVYMLLRENVDHSGLAARINQIATRHLDPETMNTYRFGVRSLKDIYFVGFSGFEWELEPRGEVSMIVEISMMAIFILLLAIANYVNLATARASERTREMGVRKVFGACRTDLIKQSLGESLIMTATATAIGLALYEVVKVAFEDSMPREMLVDFYRSPMMLGGIVLLIVVVALGAGAYPALYLSRFRPVEVLRSRPGRKSSRAILRKGLVVFQFAIAAMFVFAVILMSRQANYVATQSSGFDSSNIMLLDFFGSSAADDCRLIHQEMATNASVQVATMCDNPPGRGSTSWFVFYRNEQRDERDRFYAPGYYVDCDYVNTFSMKLFDGRWFSRDVASDISGAVVVSKDLADTLWGGDAIGRRMITKAGELEVIGVVDCSVGDAIGLSQRRGLIWRMNPERLSCLALKIAPEKATEAIGAVSAAWQRALPNTEYSYTFLDEEIAKGREKSIGERRIFSWLAGGAILIACLGVFGLVSFSAAQRTKEIGIRKVLGAPLVSIASLLSREFIWPVLGAGVVGSAMGYLISQDILRGLAVRVPIGIDIPIITIAMSLLAAVLIGGLEALRAGLASPVETLKYE
jgi:putative ABC transport system permease protein